MLGRREQRTSAFLQQMERDKHGERSHTHTFSEQVCRETLALHISPFTSKVWITAAAQSFLHTLLEKERNARWRTDLRLKREASHQDIAIKRAEPTHWQTRAPSQITNNCTYLTETFWTSAEGTKKPRASIGNQRTESRAKGNKGTREHCKIIDKKLEKKEEVSSVMQWTERALEGRETRNLGNERIKPHDWNLVELWETVGTGITGTWGTGSTGNKDARGESEKSRGFRNKRTKPEKKKKRRGQGS